MEFDWIETLRPQPRKQGSDRQQIKTVLSSGDNPLTLPDIVVKRYIVY